MGLRLDLKAGGGPAPLDTIAVTTGGGRVIAMLRTRWHVYANTVVFCEWTLWIGHTWALITVVPAPAIPADGFVHS